MVERYIETAISGAVSIEVSGLWHYQGAPDPAFDADSTAIFADTTAYTSDYSNEE